MTKGGEDEDGLKSLKVDQSESGASLIWSPKDTILKPISFPGLFIESSSSRRVTCLLPVFILETDNRTNYKMFAEARPDG